MKQLIVAIDGPSGAGKGTVSGAVARSLGYRHIDTGAMFRAVAWKASHDGVALDDDTAVTALATRADLVVEGGVVRIDGHDVTRAIRTAEMDRMVPTVARQPGLRAVLVDRQRAMGRDGGVVMEGRDIGSVVFPDADVKVYLDASEAERARRRLGDQAYAAQGAEQAAVAEAIAARDQADRTRATAPLTLAPGAVYIDTTALGIEQVVAQVIALVKAKL